MICSKLIGAIDVIVFRPLFTCFNEFRDQTLGESAYRGGTSCNTSSHKQN